MENENASSKIKLEKQIFHISKDGPLNWSDIKHLKLEDDDEIHSGWVEDDAFDYHGYWNNQITRMVEETDKQFEARLGRNRRSNEILKERRKESYLRLKKEFEDGLE